MAYMNEEAFENTVKTGRMTYYSRSRQCQWVKGETSGHYQYVKSIAADCDKDTLLAKVEQIGAACHTGNRSCFYTTIVGTDYDSKNPHQVFESVYNTILDRRENPKEGSYTNYLFEKGSGQDLKESGRGGDRDRHCRQKSKPGGSQVRDRRFPVPRNGTYGRAGRDLGRHHAGARRTVVLSFSPPPDGTESTC